MLNYLFYKKRNFALIENICINFLHPLPKLNTCIFDVINSFLVYEFINM